MARYLVTLVYSASRAIEVEAETEEAAINQAYTDSYVTLCHQCAHEIDLGECYDHEVEKLE